jgi:hypothetical protein
LAFAPLALLACGGSDSSDSLFAASAGAAGANAGGSGGGSSGGATTGSGTSGSAGGAAGSSATTGAAGNATSSSTSGSGGKSGSGGTSGSGGSGGALGSGGASGAGGTSSSGGTSGSGGSSGAADSGTDASVGTEGGKIVDASVDRNRVLDAGADAGCPNVFGSYDVTSATGTCGNLNANAPQTIQGTSQACFLHFNSVVQGGTGAVNGGASLSSDGTFDAASLIFGTMTRSPCTGTWDASNDTMTIVCGGALDACTVVLTRR